MTEQISHITYRSNLPFPPNEVFNWHARPGAFLRLNPPWNPVTVIEAPNSIQDGERAVIKMKGPLGIPITWKVEHSGYIEGEQFVDTQVCGPFSYWQHTHRFEEGEDGGCLLNDDIAFRLPAGKLGRVLARKFVERELKRVFTYRHAVTANDLKLHALFAAAPKLRVAITGGTGLVGTGLTALLQGAGHSVVVISRSRKRDSIYWNPASGEIEHEKLEGTDAVINLSGENVASGRWNERRKQEIMQSRVLGTKLICETIAKLKRKPGVLVSASAIGVYGNRRAQICTEETSVGDNFLAEVGVAWEAATNAASDAGIRVVLPRIGIVITPEGGALSKMLLPFLCGVGGRVGDGSQFMSWISYDDTIYALYSLLLDARFSGPVNLTAPDPVTNSEFTTTLGRVLKRPTVLPAPAFALRAVLGEVADALLLASIRVQPSRLLKAGFNFAYPTLEGCLRHVLGRQD